ncbi:YhbP family protein [Biostraticola tofi]|uniref:Uncharacterized protein n=1 Tax=Biostraticola tofi TaxID=466109 RepID=A0A4R3Z0E7_9GAMM|nr:YhbP family protein [Biostraticola tofi]TCV99060.1 hypothetical protein EDC52_102394 [Biostraticola tofi]
MNRAESFDALIGYLYGQHVLTLCTGDSTSGTLWCANCFYVLDVKAMAFIIMTDSDTRHGAMLQHCRFVAGTVNDQQPEVSQLQGVQYQGQCRQLAGEALNNARALYLAQIPQAAAFSTPVWQIRLDEIKMTDNRRGFGTKIYWRRADEQRRQIASAGG